MSSSTKLMAAAGISCASLWTCWRCRDTRPVNEPESPPFNPNAGPIRVETNPEIDVECIDKSVKTTINLDIDTKQFILDLENKTTMIIQHQTNMMNLIEKSDLLKPILFIIEPGGILIDPKEIIINSNETETEFNSKIHGFNSDNNLVFGLGSDINKINVYRPQVLRTFGWFHRLQITTKRPIEIIAYSNIFDKTSLLYHMNVIQTKYNLLFSKNININQWFKFLGGITTNRPKRLQG